ncbi:response regulator [bacterium]|nr:response regulator [bacterium]
MTDYSILIVDHDDTERQALVDYLNARYKTTGASSGQEVFALLKRHHFDLVIADIDLPDLNGFKVLKHCREKYPAIKTALLSAYDVDSYIKLSREKSITNIIIKDSPFNFDELGWTAHNLLTGDFFGLKRHLDSNGHIKKICLQDSDAIQASITTIIEYFSQVSDNGDLLDTCDLLLDELLYNAMIHAPRDEQGRKKYQNRQHIVLEAHEQVMCHYGYDERKLGFAVVDNFGTLENTRVMDVLDRHISGAGQHDDSGRGLYISRGLADRFIINIRRGIQTEIICLLYREAGQHIIKPLCINQI